MAYTILMIDDNVAWHRLFLDTIQEEGSDTEFFFVETGKEGLALYSELCAQNKKPDLVLIDVRLDGEDGREVAKEMKAKYPDSNLCFITFYFSDVIGMDLGIPVISKQLEAPDVIRAIKRAIKGEHVV